MNDLNKKAIGGLVQLVVILSALLFLPVWTLRYWQAWVLVIVFFVSALAITIYLMRNDPKLLERRIKAGPGAEKERSQKIIQFLAMISFAAIFVLPSIDHRFAWSTVPAYAVAMGDIVVVLGFLVVFLVFKENTFTSAVIEVSAGQKLIATGPYATVRHPMYTGTLAMLSGVPVALGSWWGLLTIVPMTLLLAWRLLEEEKFLAKNLPGYPEYRGKVRWRLVPFVW